MTPFIRKKLIIITPGNFFPYHFFFSCFTLSIVNANHLSGSIYKYSMCLCHITQIPFWWVDLHFNFWQMAVEKILMFVTSWPKHLWDSVSLWSVTIFDEGATWILKSLLRGEFPSLSSTSVWGQINFFIVLSHWDFLSCYCSIPQPNLTNITTVILIIHTGKWILKIYT